MADKLYDRVIVNTRESVISDDWNRAMSQLDRTMRDMMLMLLSGRVSTSNEGPNPRTEFIGQGFRPMASSPAGMSCILKAGLGFYYDASSVPSDLTPGIGPGATAIDDLSPWKPLYLDGDVTISGVPAADPTNPRRDIIEVAYKRAFGDSSSRGILNTTTGQRPPDTVMKTLGFTLSASDVSINGSGKINYKSGTPAGSPSAPSVTSGYIKIGEVYVPATDTAINENQVADFRALAFPNGIGEAAVVVSIDLATGTPTLERALTPPGIRLGICNAASGPDRFDLVLIGNFDHGAIGGTVGDVLTIGANGSLWTVEAQSPGSAGGVYNVDGSLQTALAAGTPAINAALNQPTLRWIVTPKKQSGSTTAQSTSGTIYLMLRVSFGNA